MIVIWEFSGAGETGGSKTLSRSQSITNTPYTNITKKQPIAISLLTMPTIYNVGQGGVSTEGVCYGFQMLIAIQMPPTLMDACSKLYTISHMHIPRSTVTCVAVENAN